VEKIFLPVNYKVSGGGTHQQEFGVLKRKLQLCIRRNSFRRLKTVKLCLPEEKRKPSFRTPKSCGLLAA
jgi:hypothetical protein